MKKEELEAIGLTADQIRAVQRLHGIDMEKARKKSTSEKDEKIQAIIAVANVLKNPENIDKILHYVTSSYHREITSESKTAEKEEKENA